MSEHCVSLGILLTGLVQGRGLRSRIASLANSSQLSGSVRNTRHGVFVHVMGADNSLREFCRQLDAVLRTYGGCQRHPDIVWPATDSAGFQIVQATALDAENSVGDSRASGGEVGTGAHLSAPVPVDLGICRRCLEELTDSEHRRFAWALNGCSDCGPRYSILYSMPWERSATVMAEWPICADCDAEFHSLNDRRGHSQAIGCPSCGPQILRPGTDIQWNLMADVLRAGELLLLKGIGGYQLLCDATSEQAVQKIRHLKQRYGKPLAVMIPSEEWVCDHISAPEERSLKSRENPIVILSGSPITSLAPSVTVGMKSQGVFLPSSGIHFQLLRAMQRPLVVTSANTESDPIIYEDHEIRTLTEASECGLLLHDRRIVRPVDDSVVRVISNQPVTIRPGRGLTPMTLPLSTSRCLLAMGGQQKVTVSLSNGAQSVMGPHLGDLDTISGRARFMQQVQGLLNLYEMTPELIVHDLHPDYFTVNWALQQNCRTMAVQHHHAHVVAGMLEHGLSDQVLGIAFDGSGFGPDGTIWGGEFLLADRRQYQRAGCLHPFGLAGGEAAIREPWRVAVALLAEAFPEMNANDVSRLLSGSADISGDHSRSRSRQEVHQIQLLLNSGYAILTTSMGRLFDGVACLILGIKEASFEGAPAMMLEEASYEFQGPGAAAISGLPTMIGELPAVSWLSNTASSSGVECPIEADWRPLVRNIVYLIQQGLNASYLAWIFHRSVANLILEFAERIPERPVVLSGGCFQNRQLAEMVMASLAERGRQVVMPCRIPPNDGGLSAGQLAIAAARLDAHSSIDCPGTYDD